MRYVILFLALVSLPLLMACDPAAPIPVSQRKASATPPKSPQPPPAGGHDHDAEDNASRITLADAKASFDKGEALFIDTRPKETFDQERIKGAINLTLQDDAAKYSAIPKGKKIIIYCS